MSDIWYDVRFAIRVLLKSPGFVLVALLTLALGIGANATMFTIADSVLLQPLPYRNSDRLVSITAQDRGTGIKGFNISFTRITMLHEQSRTLESIGAYLASGASLTTSGVPEQVPSAVATQNFFEVFGVQPAIGRGFTPAEDQPGGANVAIVSDAFWHSHFGGSPDLIGKSIPIDGHSVTIVGILPASYRFPFVQPEPQIWFPRVFENPLFPPDRVRSGAAYLTVYARLRPGESIAHAQTEMDSLGSVYTSNFPGFGDAHRFTVQVASLKETLVGPLRTSVIVLLVAVGFVLLMGCVNLASLLLVRASARQKEIAVRYALGASRGRLLRQLLTESFLLSLAGGAIALVLAANAPHLLRLLPPGTLPRVDEITMNGRVVLFSLVLCVVTGLGFGLVPALQTSGNKLYDALKESGRSASGGRRAGRFRASLVVGEVALALILVSSAGLLLKSFEKLVNVNPGFDPRNVMSFSMSLPLSRYPDRPKQSEFWRRLVEDVKTLPAVQSAGVNSYLPIGSGTRFVFMCTEGTPCVGEGRDPVAAVRHVTPDYFKAMRIPLLRGRVFADSDNANSRPVAVINQNLAGKFFAGQDPVGKFVIQTRGNIQTVIVGVVASVKSAGLNAADLAELYLPQEQSPVPVTTMSLVVRSDQPPEPLIASVRSVVAKLDPDLPLSNILPMEDVVSASVAQPRLTALLTAAFGILALSLAAIGIYGVMANSVLQRQQEIAIRMAMGATPSSILRLVVGQGLKLVLAGVILGLLGALAFTRVLASVLFEISARDPITLTTVTVVLVVVAMSACYIPALRSMRVDPITALRNE